MRGYDRSGGLRNVSGGEDREGVLLMNYTNETIPIECGECIPTHFEEGLVNMMKHLATTHENYTPQEVSEYATRWMDDAWDKLDEANWKQLTEQQRKEWRAAQHGR